MSKVSEAQQSFAMLSASYSFTLKYTQHKPSSARIPVLSLVKKQKNPPKKPEMAKKQMKDRKENLAGFSQHGFRRQILGYWLRSMVLNILCWYSVFLKLTIFMLEKSSLPRNVILFSSNLDTKRHSLRFKADQAHILYFMVGKAVGQITWCFSK